MTDARRGRSGSGQAGVRLSKPLPGEPSSPPPAWAPPLASTESRTRRTRHFLEAVWGEPAAVMLSFSGPGEDPAPVSREDLGHLAGPEFPIVSWRRGVFTLNYVHCEELPPGFWEFLRRRALQTGDPGRMKTALATWRDRGGIPGESVYQARFFLSVLDDPAEARRSLERCEHQPLSRGWLLPAAVAWKTLFGDQARADALLARSQPAFDDPDGQFHRALALADCGHEDEANQIFRSLCAAPSSWVALHNGPAALVKALESGCLDLTAARRDLAAMEARSLEPQALIRLAWCQAMILGDEAAAERILHRASGQTADWLACQRLAWAWLYMFARRDPVGEILERALQTVSSVVSLTAVARAWATLLGDPRGMDRLLEQKREVLNAGSDFAEVAGLVADVHGPGPRAREWLEAGERLIDRSYDCEKLSEAWRAIFGDEQRAARLAGRGESLHEDEMESWDPLKG